MLGHLVLLKQTNKQKITNPHKQNESIRNTYIWQRASMFPSIIKNSDKLLRKKTINRKIGKRLKYVLHRRRYLIEQKSYKKISNSN